ncbi:MAG: arginine--tRNA ligase [Crocinitomicaceae bacterium]
MNLEKEISVVLKDWGSTYETEISDELIQFQKTRKDMEGDLTLLVFPFVKMAKKSPQMVGEEIGELLKKRLDFVSAYQAVNGFLNLVIADSYWIGRLNEIIADEYFGNAKKRNERMMVEFSSPNTNKPLHLGHLRNNFLGFSVSRILEANGYDVVKTQIINDRGIHICKSMLAWQKFGENETPASSGLKGDKFVGKYYVEFDKALKIETAELLENWKKEQFGDASPEIIAEFKKLQSAHDIKADDPKAQKGIADKIKKLVNNHTTLMQEAKTMLQKWEAKDEETVALWTKMNNWVYEGFNATYESIDVDFDTLYYESDTYLSGKEMVDIGLEKGVFYKKDDGSFWIDLTDEGLDEKLVLRGDGTAVYVTQDIGTAQQRMKEYPDLNGIVYTVGNEQEYHFKVLFLILEKLGYKWAKNCHHLSYGMIDLRNDKGEVGKMKSREGTVVDADDLVHEVTEMARVLTEERGHIDAMTDNEKLELYRMIGLGALKYFLLKVDPQKRMTFNPDESVELNGNTGPFLQYVHARISSVLRKSVSTGQVDENVSLESIEKEIIKHLAEYPAVIQQAGIEYSPALIANYVYELCKRYNSFWQNIHILSEPNQELQRMRSQMSAQVAKVIRSATYLLGINVPQRM